MAKGGIQELALGRKDILRMDPTSLHIKEGWNCREVTFDPDNADDMALAASIAQIGVKQPLTAIWEDGKAYLTDGHRRLQATLYAMASLGAEIKSVPVQTEDRFASEADRVLSQIVRNNGKSLTPIEQGRVFKRLFDLGWSEGEIAERVGRSTVWVKDMLNLNAAPQEVTSLVCEGKVSATLAVQTLKKDKAEAGAKLGAAVKKAEEGGKKKASKKHMEAAPVERCDKTPDMLPETMTVNVENGASLSMGGDFYEIIPDPAPVNVVEAQLREFQAIAYRHLQMICGDVSQATDSYVTIRQDDATLDWTVTVGNSRYNAGSLMGALEQAAEGRSE